MPGSRTQSYGHPSCVCPECRKKESKVEESAHAIKILPTQGVFYAGMEMEMGAKH